MAGSFEQINNRKDFVRELSRAVLSCAGILKRKGPDPTLLSVQKQLQFIQDRLNSGKLFTKKERRSLDMSYRMHREFEEIRDDDELYDFKELVSLINLYMHYWPSDALASDPDNDDKIDWDDV
jgi:hypothetical protein